MDQRGTEGPPRVADIVARAGLSNQAFYRHFASRDELVTAVAEAGALRLVGDVRRRMAMTQDPVDQIRHWVRGVVDQASDPDVARSARAVLWNLRQRRGGPQMRPVGIAELLHEPLRSAGSAEPRRDADIISDAVFGRLDRFLWVAPPTTEDVDHLVDFCLWGTLGSRGPTPLGATPTGGS